MIISDLRLWKDCGYTEGSMVKPPINDSLTGYDMRITDDISPARDRIFSEIRLRTPFDDLYLMTYLQATYEMSDGSTFTFYGWIDNVQPISDTDTPTTAILWHIDYWRTYASNASYGSGMVTRRPSSYTQPPQPVNYRYIQPEDMTDIIIERYDAWWVIVRYTEDDELGAVRVLTCTFPISVDTDFSMSDGINEGFGPSFQTISRGLLDELLGLDPANILGVFISPCAPTAGSWDGDTFRFARANIKEGNAGTVYAEITMPMSGVVSGNSIGTTDDTHTTVIIGFDGETIGSIPWGVDYVRYEYRVICESASAYLQIRLSPESTRTITGSHQAGLTYSIPLPTLEVTENSWSSYAYSGARQLDMQGRQIEADKNRSVTELGYLGSAAGAVTTGAAAGAAIGSIVPGIGTAIGATAGALIGGGLSLGTKVGGLGKTELEHHYMTHAYDDSMQDMLDTVHAKQADGLLIQGNGLDCIANGFKPSALTLTYDSYSITQWENNIEIYGATVSEPKSSCASLIHGGGPLRIDNLEVTGDIPNPARAYIRDAFRKGVILK